MSKLAIIRIRGQVHMNPHRAVALRFFNLTRKFTVRVVEDTPAVRGQLNLLNPDITWGEATEETISTLAKRYPKKESYHLNPPRGGFGRKGIKIPHTQSGAFGYRGQKINDLIKRMMI